MNWSTNKVVALVLTAVALASGLTFALLRRPSDAASPSQNKNTSQPGITLRQYPSADQQALADLQNKVADRQRTKETINETTIDLKPFVNCQLTDPLADKPDHKDHTLGTLPLGVNVYGGGPFDVEGIVQINGGSIKTGPKPWPLAVQAIAIGHSFKKLHLLHSAFNIMSPEGRYPYGKLVLHYADGTAADLMLAGGVHTLRAVDGWIPQEIGQLPPQTELAWMGSSPYLDRFNPTASLHLYRTTFRNPRPDLEVKSIDYVSIMGNPGPFMVGLTIE